MRNRFSRILPGRAKSWPVFHAGLPKKSFVRAATWGSPKVLAMKVSIAPGTGPKVDLNIFTGKGGDDRSVRSRPGMISLRLAWESALPVRLAELKSHVVEPPTLEGEGYEIAVYGIPGPELKQEPEKLGAPLKEMAMLKRAGKKDVKPMRAEVFQRPDGIVVVYLFPLSAGNREKRRTRFEFEAQIGRIVVSHTFELKDMEFQGRLEL